MNSRDKEKMKRNNKKYCEKRSSREQPNRGNRSRKDSEAELVEDINATRSKSGGRVKQLNNNPSWYFSDPTLLDQVSSFSFNQFLGNSKPFIEKGLEGVFVPTSMRLLFNPSCGYSSGSYGSSGINIAAMKMYTKLSSGNSKNTQYAPQDLATLMLALGEVISFSEWGRRALGLAFTYNKRNWSYPKGIIGVSGFDAEDLLHNLAQYRMQFNAVINSINQITFPADVPYFQKCGYMYSHLWVDAESPMAQTYVYVPYSVWYVDETSYDQGTILKTVPVFDPDPGKNTPKDYEEAAAKRMITFEVYLTKLSNMIQAILNSATFQFIYADVLRLYPNSGYLTIPFVSEDYIVLPEYDPMALLQINNATFFGAPSGSEFKDGESTPSNDVYPKVDTNSLVYMPQWSGKKSTIPFEPKIINFPHSMGDPDVTQRVEATRFTIIADGEGTEGDEFWYKNVAMPDHYLCLFSVWGDTNTVPQTSYNCWVPSTEDLEETESYYIAALDKFANAPRLYLVLDNGGKPKVVDTSGDLDYFTTIDNAYLKRVNDLAYVNLFEFE